MQKAPIPPTLRVGILGGGQLGCMLTDAALRMQLSPLILCEASAPAVALFPQNVVVGSMTSENDLRAFFSRVDQVAFENEFLDCSLLEKAARDLPVRFGPGLDVIRSLQDKLTQKRLLTQLGLPTSPFVELHPGLAPEKLRSEVDAAFEKFAGEVVFKWSRMGYDGKGVHLAKDTADGRMQALKFCEASLSSGVPVYAEQKIRFTRELAIVACRSTSGEFAAFPLVVSEQTHGICFKVLGPAQALGVPAALEHEARECARTLAESMNLVGSFALELFETADKKIQINEIAPRVHNSGHYTQDACETSQFENHWHALLGQRLGATKCRPAFGMLNLLGPEGVAMKVAQNGELPFADPETPMRLHWYAKAEIRPWRKVGHVNSVADAPEKIPLLDQAFDRYHEQWTHSLRESLERKKPS